MRYAKFIALALLIISQGALISTAKADETACIAIYPCLESGDIDPRFDVDGLCGDKWRAQCADVRAGIISEQFNSCQEDNAALRIESEKLAAEHRKLQKAIRRLKQAKARR